MSSLVHPTARTARMACASICTRRALTTSASRSEAAPKPRKPSPYRLPSLPTFLGTFAPLHAAGWRLEPLDTAGEGMTSHSARDDLFSGADLQGRRLTRAYTFPRDREGWRALTKLLGEVGEAVEAEDHHPVITAGPIADLPRGVETPEEGYMLCIATHTHTPMPPLPSEGVVFEGKPRPGVTTKDLRLAERVEKLFEDGRS